MRDPDDPKYADDAITADEDGPEDERRVGWRDWPGGALKRLRARRTEDVR